MNFQSTIQRIPMRFTDRIKKEMSEGIVRALLEDGGYRVIDSSIEKVVREIFYLSSRHMHSWAIQESRRPKFFRLFTLNYGQQSRKVTNHLELKELLIAFSLPYFFLVASVIVILSALRFVFLLEN